MKTQTREERYRFFHEHASGIVGETARGALELARAEELLAAAVSDGWARVRWEWDELEPIVPEGMTDEQYHAKIDSGEWEGPFCVRLELAGSTVASLGGIVLAGRGPRYGYSGRIYGTSDESDELGDGWSPDPYARVLEAELASEALEALRYPSRVGPIARILGNVAV